jgi:hypothetical protein
LPAIGKVLAAMVYFGARCFARSAFCLSCGFEASDRNSACRRWPPGPADYRDPSSGEININQMMTELEANRAAFASTLVTPQR